MRTLNDVTPKQLNIKASVCKYRQLTSGEELICCLLVCIEYITTQSETTILKMERERETGGTLYVEID